MKKVRTLATALAIGAMTVSTMIPVCAAEPSHSTEVTYEGTQKEEWTLTVPAKMAPGESGTVYLQGYFPANKTATVAADKTVTLKNSITPTDTKTLNVLFDGIKAPGSNSSQVYEKQTVSTDNITAALFGTWDGTFNYTVTVQ